MAKKKQNIDPYEMEMLDLLNEVGGEMTIKYHTAKLTLTKADLQQMRENGVKTDVTTCILFGLAASLQDEEKVKYYLQEANEAGAVPSVTFEAAEGETLNITGKEENPMVDQLVQAVKNQKTIRK